MKQIQLQTIISTWILFMLCLNTNAQTTINAASNRAIIQGNVFEYTIGEMSLVSTEHGSNLIVTQGYLQPTSQQPSSISNHDGSNSNDMKVYPNPTLNMLNIESTENIACNVIYDLYDAAGKVVIHKEDNLHEGNNKRTIDFSSFAAGSYFLLVKKFSSTQEISTYSFKVQKSN